MSTTTEALRMARDMIATERQAFADCNVRPDGGFDEEDAEAVADYDRALAQIDAALAASEAQAEPVALPVAVNRALFAPECDRLSEWALTGPAQRAALESFAERLLLTHQPAPQQPAPAERGERGEQTAQGVAKLVDRLLAYSDIRRNDPRENREALRDLILGELNDELEAVRRAALSAAPRVPLTDEQVLACVRSVGAPAPMGLMRDRGAYEVTEPTWFLTQLVRAIERAHGIAAAPQPEGGHS